MQKLLGRLARIAKGPVTGEGGKQIAYCPHQIYLSPTLLRGFTCKTGCFACCVPCTLDFTADEFAKMRWARDIHREARLRFSERLVHVNGQSFTIFTYDQSSLPSCPFLRSTPERANGCGFWTRDNSTQPLECAAAPQLRMESHENTIEVVPNLLERGGIFRFSIICKKPFGHAHYMLRRGAPAQCIFGDVEVKQIFNRLDDPTILDDTINLLMRYQHWADYFEIKTHIPAIIRALNCYPRAMKTYIHKTNSLPKLFKVTLAA